MVKNNKNLYDSADLSNEKILLIGGSGFIGHHLALELKKMQKFLF